jgi:hypothetical protein
MDDTDNLLKIKQYGISDGVLFCSDNNNMYKLYNISNFFKNKKTFVL